MITKMKAVAFHSSVRLRLTAAGFLKNKDNLVIGVKCQAKVVKNRLGPPHRKCDFEIYFDSGIDNKASVIKTLKDREIIKGSGAWYSFVIEETGEEIKFQAKEYAKLIADRPEIDKMLYDKLCKAVIMTYKDNNNITRLDDDVSVDPSLEGLD